MKPCKPNNSQAPKIYILYNTTRSMLYIPEAEHLVNKYMTLISGVSFHNLMEIQMVTCMNISRKNEGLL